MGETPKLALTDMATPKAIIKRPRPKMMILEIVLFLFMQVHVKISGDKSTKTFILLPGESIKILKVYSPYPERLIT